MPFSGFNREYLENGSRYS